VLGETELSYIEALSDDRQTEAASHLFSLAPGLVLITRGVTVPRAFLEAAESSGTPLAVCAEETSFAITEIHTLLDERLAPRTRIHGVLVDVFEVGVLLLGKSGIGKSECALDLVQRGHRLVADDVIECDYRPPGMVFGEAAPLLRNHIEVRGLGILDIKELFGVTAIRDRKRIDIIVQFEEGNVEQKLDRLGIDGRTRDILGVPIREVMLVLRPGRSASSLIEMAARNELLRAAGKDSSLDFVDRIDQSLVHRPREATPATSAAAVGLVRRPNESGSMHAVVPPRPSTPRPHPPPSEFESQKPPPPTPRKATT
jgi:HPr kinase/phosphorylase